MQRPGKETIKRIKQAAEAVSSSPCRGGVGLEAPMNNCHFKGEINNCHFEPKARNLKFPFPPVLRGQGEAAETANCFGSRAS